MFQRGRYGLNQGKGEGRLWPALFFCVEIIMPKGPFLPSDFTAMKFSTAADKAEFENTLLRFIESEWAPTLFTKSFYNRSPCASGILLTTTALNSTRSCFHLSPLRCGF
jgi:hypothetical protein